MPNTVDFTGRPFHFIGIGGIGMSALAYVLAKRKLPVSGSDIHSSHITKRLQAVGTHVFGSQDAANLEFFQPTEDSAYEALPTAVIGISDRLEPSREPVETGATRSSNRGSSTNLRAMALPQVICSTAINPANSEYRAAIELGCPIFHRSDLLAALIQDYQSIAVAGTHGKTTTSSLIGYLLLQAGLDPTIVVGGEVNAWGGNARLGDGPYLVAEADESDGSLSRLSAAIGVITNIELDHPDHYESLEEVISTFQIFAKRCKTLVGCIDCAVVRDSLQPAISYSLQRDSGADYTVDRVDYRADGTEAQVWERGEILGKLSLKLLGKHNLSNALAAVAVGRQLGMDFEVIAEAIATFEGARRRFELRGERNGIYFVDDYAHHPSELLATLSAARLQVLPPRRLVAIFQPHRYSRTLAFLPEFAQSFKDADIVILSDIYSAGEPNLGQISGEQVAELVAGNHPNVHYQPSLPSICKLLTDTLRPGDLALFLGAGNLNQIIPEVMAFYQKTDEASLK
ncbi:UDP-N-acetylmuramate--L-alanine ligase [Coleofasciculus sp. FACHB-64]|uniref:UDP-N-acetylmuramate--L-alanine ligase n=1 Tax=Cyanophyceae TaxID=3028117 RepID=UPI0016839DAD|nr:MULTISPECIES: UDP-N-acetylmuramate--L-alanine ligase [unclassified Coleofasciculus]MBD1837698.1 UDP-N-acetylmuramate--L-alanine ligase [Coleofasciculus sp. FACHB-501]MBD1882203.1 UDP-N-acetylmuramate--L-alanine ligase [Coleofasciculus sp. FACHB-T130]MBD1890040.1 UDP-N-acetylmuramate--L-alanine ligase [Coleofasciculus sp. FACHB-SPT9]MBD1898948.1 UDP-N-acetylmuramate--L-alanine ligase [Coleofasciculus sp. FACHB-125]MBD2046960.1 UDP-N-acetylmuramate--L-alanine ligase [Coleofasciculus sp. FACHB